MRTGTVAMQTVKPGRQEDAIALASEAVKLFERVGAEEVTYRFGGPGTPANSASFKFEAASQRAMGELIDRLLQDSDYQSLMQRVGGPDSPIVEGELLTFSVLDTGLPAGTPGQVGTLVSWRPHGGRVADAIALAIDAGRVLLRLGATRARVVQVTSGEGLPLFVSATESASFAAQGAWRDALETDEEWQQIATRLTAADAPGSFVRFAEWYRVL